MITKMKLRSARSNWSIFLLLFFTTAFFWRAIFQKEIFYYRDLFYFHYPLRNYWAQVIHDAEMPFLNIALNAGQPILANPNYATFYPPTWLYVLLPFDVAWNLILAGHVFWAALGMYLLARMYHCEKIPSLCAAITFAFSGAFLSCINYSNMAIAGSWIPWIAAACRQAFQVGGRWIQATAVGCVLQFLSGEPTVSLITGISIALFWIVAIVRAKAKTVPFRRALYISILFLLLISIQLIPALLWLPHSSRGTGLDVLQSSLFWSLHPARLIELFVPDYYGNVMSPLLSEFWGNKFSDAGYPYILRFYCGWVPLLIAPLAWKFPEGRTALIFAIVSLFMSMGRWIPGFESIYAVLPIFQFVRYPEKFLIFFTFGIAFATAIGLNQWSKNSRLRPILAALVVFLLPILFFGFCSFPEDLQANQRTQQRTSVLYACLYAGTGFCVLAINLKSNLRRYANAVLLCFVILNLAPFTIDIPETESLNEVHAPNPLLTKFPELKDLNIFHRGETQSDLIFSGTSDPEILLRDSLYPLTGLTYSVRYGATNDIDRMGAHSSWKRQFMIRKQFPSPETLEVMRKSSINFVISFKPEISNELRLYGEIPVGEANTLYVYELTPSALPEIRWHEGSGHIGISLLTRNRIVLQTNTQHSGKLLIVRNAIPGWSAVMDGESIAVEKSVDGFLMVDLPQGKHSIDLRYVPPGFKTGAFITICGFVLLLATLTHRVIHKNIDGKNSGVLDAHPTT